MPLHELNVEGRQGGSHNNGPVVLLAYRTIENTFGSLDLPKPPCLMNGYVHSGSKERQKNTFSPVGNASAAGSVRDVGSLGAIATNGDDVHLCDKSEQVVPSPSSSASKKNQRRKNYRYKQKRKKQEQEQKLWQQEQEHWQQEQEHWQQEQEHWQQEDWQQEIQECEIKDWEKMCFGLKPYGPGDMIHFELRDLTLQQGSTVDLSRMNSYCPGKRHALPIQWTSYKFPSAPGQFDDAEL